MTQSHHRLLWASMVASLGLASCGGGSDQRAVEVSSSSKITVQSPLSSSEENLTEGISSKTQQANFGQPQSAQAVASMAKRLAAYFDGKHPLVAAAPGGGYTSTATSTKAASMVRKSATLTPRAVYRFLNTATGVHFYTASPDERDWVRANLPGFNFEGPAFFALSNDAEALSPVYRFYNKVTGTHFYTVNPAERDAVLVQFSDIFNLEGVSWYASGQTAVGWRPIYRFFNKLTGTHFYSASDQERDNIRNTIPSLTYEGIGYYVRGSETPFVPVADPSSCTAYAPAISSSSLPSQYTATLILKASSINEAFLNNRGDIAFRAPDAITGRTLVHYRNATDGQLKRLFPPGSELVPFMDAQQYGLISMDSEGALLLTQGGSMMFYDQYSPISSAPDALRYQNGVVTSVPGMKNASEANHRAGRFTFFEAIDRSNDNGYLQWATASAPSYLDGNAIGQTPNIESISNREIAVNHCGFGLDMSGRSEDGLYWLNGSISVEQWSFQFAFGQNDSLRILGTNNRRAVVGYSEGYPMVDNLIGYLKYGPTQERAFVNFIPRDVNENLVAVGEQVTIPSGAMQPITPVSGDGYIFTIDGPPQPIKSRVPALNQAGTKILPLKINDNQQVLASVELSCNAPSNTNSLGDACGSKYVYLLTPQ